VGKDYPSQQTPDVANSEFQAAQYMIERLFSRVSTATLVQVQKVTTSGQVAPVGQVDVVPLVNMIDGVSTNYKHGPVHNLAYFRYQGGNKAIILDPKVNDIGVAVFADRDISVVKKTKAQSQPGSFRRWDMADGLFFPCFLGAAPTSYIQFQDNGSIAISPDNGTTSILIEAGKITLTAATIVWASSNILAGGADASKPVGMLGSVDSNGDTLVSGLSTVMKAK